MQLIITRHAKADLDALNAYLKNRSPSGLRSVMASLKTTMATIPEGISRGRKSPLREDIWEKVDTKYGYVIPYFIEDDTVYVLRIYNSRRQGLTAKDIEESLKTRIDE